MPNYLHPGCQSCPEKHHKAILFCEEVALWLKIFSLVWDRFSRVPWYLMSERSLCKVSLCSRKSSLEIYDKFAQQLLLESFLDILLDILQGLFLWESSCTEVPVQLGPVNRQHLSQALYSLGKLQEICAELFGWNDDDKVILAKFHLLQIVLQALDGSPYAWQ